MCVSVCPSQGVGLPSELPRVCQCVRLQQKQLHGLGEGVPRVVIHQPPWALCGLPPRSSDHTQEVEAAPSGRSAAATCAPPRRIAALTGKLLKQTEHWHLCVSSSERHCGPHWIQPTIRLIFNAFLFVFYFFVFCTIQGLMYSNPLAYKYTKRPLTLIEEG